ncbi:peptidylprolyl isomerase [Planctomicrobium piriforme]|uniref:peptidylprolyl isomerase n=1 Tax=Planctomicrobium piriforme TaxID=1576369 RepID=A0A1I3RTG6_9PLAN|nr:peptidylprolyl isomerase [Planctomicrobium piriforme]SFJ48899.1 Peptidyl-prolyl cis-trans isomerase (rotamase)-cyclophilin family [Planctomicrobium piriforme]
MKMRSLFRWLATYRQVKSYRKRRTTRRFGQMIECCEQRAMLSGNVTVTVASGAATITGDTSDNSIQIAVSGTNLVVTGLNGTTINNTTSFTLATNATTFTGTTSINMGAGSDSVFIGNGVTLTGNVTLTDTSGNNFFATRSATINGTFSATMGSGADSFSTESTTISGAVTLLTGGGNDFVSMLSTTINGATAISTVEGDDRIVIDQSTLKNLSMSTSDGADSIALRQTTIGGNLAADLGRQRDFMSLQNVTVSGSTSITAGRGRDSIVFDGTNTLSGSASIKGEGGRNAITKSSGTSFAGGVQQRRFGRRTVDPTLITSQLTDATTGIYPAATALRTKVTTAIGMPVTTLTTDTSGNANTIQSNGTLATRQNTFVITGTTDAGNTVAVDADGDGQYDDGTATANSSGAYSVSVTLANGGHAVSVKSSNTTGQSLTKAVDIYKVIGSLVRFTSSEGTFDVELYDADAPLTVANFKSYLDDYANSIIHRSTDATTEGLAVIQGGGFVLNSGEVVPVTTTAPVTNEFKAANSNERGTLALALPAGNINGGTSQWFINTADNSSIDTGKYTVFGQVIGTGMTVVDDIHDLSTSNLNGLYADPANAGSTLQALSTVPLDGYAEFGQTVTGTAAVTSGSTTVTGTGTTFTTSLKVGQVITVGGVERTVATIVSDTQLTVNSAFTATATSAAIKANTKPTASQFVTFTSIATILPAT